MRLRRFWLGRPALWFFWDKLRPAKTESLPVAANVKAELEVVYINSKYVEDSGLGPRLRADGYRLLWSDEDKVPRRTQLEGWELAVEELSAPVIEVCRAPK